MRRNQITTLACLLLSLSLTIACGEDDAGTGPLIYPPSVTTGSASSVGVSSAALSGAVDAVGIEASFWFEYGLDMSYGDATPEEVMAPTPAGPQAAIGQLSGLTSQTTYHYRLVARNIAGTTTGEDATFVTLIANQEPDTRLVGAPTDTLAGEVRWPAYWTGSDSDGFVVGYEWRFADHGSDGTLDPPDSLGVPWSMTTVTDSVFTWPDGLGSRTFFIRAVDNLEARDPTPAYLAITH